MASNSSPKNLAGYVESFKETKDPDILMDLKRKLSVASEEEKDQLRTDLASNKTQADLDKATIREPRTSAGVKEKYAQLEKEPFSEKEIAQEIEDYNRTLTNYKTLDSELKAKKTEYFNKNRKNSESGKYSPPSTLPSHAQLLNIQGIEDEIIIIDEALAKKGNKIKRDVLTIFEQADNEALETIREKLDKMILGGDLKHEILHPYAVELGKRGLLVKKRPSQEANIKKSAPVEKISALGPKEEEKPDATPPAFTEPPKPTEQIAIDNIKTNETADDSFMVEGKEKNPHDAAQAIFATDEDAYDNIKEAELKAAQGMDSFTPDPKKPVDKITPDSAQSLTSGGQLEITPATDKKEDIQTVPKENPASASITTKEDAKPKEKTPETPAKPQGILKVNPDGTLIAENVEPRTQSLSYDQNSTKNTPRNPAEARIAEIKQSLQDNKLPENLNATKSATNEDLPRPDLVPNTVKGTVDTNKEPIAATNEAKLETKPNDNITVDNVEATPSGIPPVAATPDNSLPVTPERQPVPLKKKKGLLGRIFGSFSREKDPDSSAAAALEKGKAEVSIAESQNKAE